MSKKGKVNVGIYIIIIVHLQIVGNRVHRQSKEGYKRLHPVSVSTDKQMLGGIYGTNTEFDAAGFDVTSAVL